jgi:hypothetical protein
VTPPLPLVVVAVVVVVVGAVVVVGLVVVEAVSVLVVLVVVGALVVVETELCELRLDVVELSLLLLPAITTTATINPTMIASSAATR